MRWRFACRKVIGELCGDQDLWESGDSVTGQREKVNGDAVVGKASQIPWVPVSCNSPSELSEIETREVSLTSPH